MNSGGKESYTVSIFDFWVGRNLAEQRFLDQSLFDIVPRGQSWDYIYPGDYIADLHLRKRGNRLAVNDVPVPAKAKRTTWLMQKDVLKRGWKRRQLDELPEPLYCNRGRGQNYTHGLTVPCRGKSKEDEGKYMQRKKRPEILPSESADSLRISATFTANEQRQPIWDVKASRKLDDFEQELARRAVAEEDLPPWD